MKGRPGSIVNISPATANTVSTSTEKAKIESLKNNPFGCPRNFVSDRLVYTVISSRAGGLSVSANLNPDKYCNFDCAYCEVDRAESSGHRWVDVTALSADLTQVLK